MSLEVRIELLSDTAPGTGGSGQGVDRDVPADVYGVPYIPGRRLKGLLREACQEVWEALELAGQEQWLDAKLVRVNVLFGTPDQSGMATIHDARLAGETFGDSGDAEALQTWLAWAADQRESPFQPETVLHSFTTIRTQTAINPDTGAAKDNALRATRLLRQGLCFHGGVSLSDDGEQIVERARRTLALSSGVLRQLGGARHRGAGHVRVYLWDERDLTASAIDEVMNDLDTSQGKKR
jgi:CRISPR/Cas system CSM-associated protein Csm3 (group 7 of RAMP superfamily)